MRKQVTIAGGGLAGLSLGVALCSRGVPVQIHEAGVYPRHRVCGEFICGVEEATLQTLGIADLLSDAVRCQDTVWFYRGRPVYQKILPKPAYGISRYLLDERLADQFRELGGDLYQNSRLSNDAVANEGTICATGRRAANNDWVGLKFHARGLSLGSDLELHFGKRAYLGLSRIENGLINVCGLFRRRSGLSASKNELPLAYLEACEMTALLNRLECSEILMETITGISALAYGRGGEPPPDIFAIGDQAGLIPPFTGNGMSIAFESATLALEPVLAWATGALGWQAARNSAYALQGKAFAGRRRVAGLIHPLLYRPSGQRLLSLFARSRLIPFTPLFKLTH